jgi:hypothetical protein
MNRKQFVILLVAVAILGAAGLLLHQRDSDSWHSGNLAAGQDLLPNLPVNDVTQIIIRSGTNTLNLARADAIWRVRERDGYPANFSQISELLRKIAQLKIVQTDDVLPTQLARFQLSPLGSGADAGTAVEFKDQGGKTVGALLLGKKHMRKSAGNAPAGMGDDSWPDGRYVLTGTDTQSVAVISDPLDDVEPQPERWLNRDFVSMDRPQSITAQFPTGTNSWKLVRNSETNDWELADAHPGEKLDSAKITSLATPFAGVSFDDVGPRRGTAATDGDTVMTVETFNGLTFVANIGAKENEHYPVSFSISLNGAAKATPTANSGAAIFAQQGAFTNWIYQVPAYGLEELLKTRQQLLVDSVTNAPASAER